jgi:hypothetical protein
MNRLESIEKSFDITFCIYLVLESAVVERFNKTSCLYTCELIDLLICNCYWVKCLVGWSGWRSQGKIPTRAANHNIKFLLVRWSSPSVLPFKI